MRTPNTSLQNITQPFRPIDVAMKLKSYEKQKQHAKQQQQQQQQRKIFCVWNNVIHTSKIYSYHLKQNKWPHTKTVGEWCFFFSSARGLIANGISFFFSFCSKIHEKKIIKLIYSIIREFTVRGTAFYCFTVICDRYHRVELERQKDILCSFRFRCSRAQ